MSIKEQIRVRLGGGPAYECEHCGLDYESDRLNCPACGFTVRKVR